MSKKCNFITFGKMNRYMFLILVEGLSFYFLNLVRGESKFIGEKNLHPIVFNISYAFGSCLSFFLMIFHHIRNKRKNKSITLYLSEQNNNIRISLKEKLLWLSLDSIIDFIASTLNIIFWSNRDNYLNVWSFYVIFLALFSRLILKNKLYKHHIVCIIIIVIVMILYNLVTKKLNIENLKGYYDIFLISILNAMLYSLENVLDKYFMLIKYIKPYEILFVKGIIVLVLSIITLIITTNVGNVDNFWDYIYNLDTKEVLIFISLIFIYFIDSLFILLIIYFFSPIHIMLTDFVSDIISFFVYINETEILTNIFVIIFTFINSFTILVFIELIELNFCGLSTMTIKNIETRAKIDALEEEEEKDESDKIIDKIVTFDEYEFELKKAQEIETNTNSYEMKIFG